MPMSGAPDEQPRRISYRELLGLVRRTAPRPTCSRRSAARRPGVAVHAAEPGQTHATLWGAETAGYAVPIDFLLQPNTLAALLKAPARASSLRSVPHPVLDIWQKALGAAP